jgi:hypothetical protein
LAVVVDKLVKYGAVMFTIYLILDKAKIRISPQSSHIRSTLLFCFCIYA